MQGFDEFFQLPEEPGIVLADLLPFFIGPVGGYAFLSHSIHLLGADLDLDEVPSRPHDGGVQRLIIVGLGA